MAFPWVDEECWVRISFSQFQLSFRFIRNLFYFHL